MGRKSGGLKGVPAFVGLAEVIEGEIYAALTPSTREM
jgi:hypothetical protein